MIGDVTASGGLLSSFTGSGTTYSAVFTPTASYAGSGIISILAGSFTDGLGNTSRAAVLGTPIVIDTIPPTITITRTVSVGRITTVTFTLSEVSTNFTASNITVAGGTFAKFVRPGKANAGKLYQVTFTRALNSTASCILSVAAGAFTDKLGNGNVVGTLTWK